MNQTKRITLPRRALSTAVAGGLALAGTITLLTGQGAQAQVMEQGDKVWVCKFVGKPFESERIKGGKNPIEVAWQAADKDKDGEVSVGDEFADAQGQSVVVQINGPDPGIEACMATPPTTTTGTTTTTTTTTTGTTTTTTGTTTTSTDTTTTSTGATTTTSGGPGGGVAPGVGAPDTGGTDSGTGLAGGILGGGLLLAAGAVLAGEALRRRSELTEG